MRELAGKEPLRTAGGTVLGQGGYVPEAPEGYAQRSADLDKARWAAADSNETPDGWGSERLESASPSGGSAVKPHTKTDSRSSFEPDPPASANSSAPASTTDGGAGGDEPRDVSDTSPETVSVQVGDTEAEVTHAQLDAYAYARLLIKQAPVSHLQELGIERDGAYSFAFALYPDEILERQRALALAMLSVDPEPPADLFALSVA